ncbi:divalent-cation tolerance protein CutA [Pseudanabaena sp. 'Roaring Creek']|uniref:divalent-cation tolerance protein CutA n=1 Tax=Pseudanabaena sp. 'Roaring Creek' TaxID=1681830 RepID=UPI0006D7B2AB|nr:divalent-cation tolerance protein CutA [Pseudanabaena sp. 'Roaring Creek']
MPNSELIVVMMTAPDLNLANDIAKMLIEEKLAACVQVLPAMTSTYIWDGQLCQESEHLVLIKTLANKYESLVARLTALHPYQVPEIIAIPAIAIEQNYLLWAKSILM